MKRCLNFSLLVSLLMLCFQLYPAIAQNNGLNVGVGVGVTYGLTDLEDGRGEGQGRAFLRYSLLGGLAGEFGLGVAQVSGDEYRTELYPIDYRFVLSPGGESFNPFLYAGAGMEYFKVRNAPMLALGTADKMEGWIGFIPVGAGIQCHRPAVESEADGLRHRLPTSPGAPRRSRHVLVGVTRRAHRTGRPVPIRKRTGARGVKTSGRVVGDSRPRKVPPGHRAAAMAESFLPKTRSHQQ